MRTPARGVLRPGVGGQSPLFPVPFTQAGVLSASAFLSVLSLLQSLRKKLTILQGTLSLPPVTSETVSRLVFERLATLLG